MKIDRPLLKLPRQYCARTLAAEVAALPPSAWLAHPGRIMGNDAVPLIHTVRGMGYVMRADG